MPPSWRRSTRKHRAVHRGGDAARGVHPLRRAGQGHELVGRGKNIDHADRRPAQVSTIKRADFLRLLQSHADLCMNAVQQLSARYHDAQREIRALSLAHNTAEKLARLLLDWCASTGRPLADGMPLRVPYTHAEIAQMIGSTRETITRVLSDFRRGNVLEANGVGLIVRDRRALEAMIFTTRQAARRRRSHANPAAAMTAHKTPTVLATATRLAGWRLQNSRKERTARPGANTRRGSTPRSSSSVTTTTAPTGARIRRKIHRKRGWARTAIGCDSSTLPWRRPARRLRASSPAAARSPASRGSSP